ncbi:MAG: CPBP family glutamic-type intramembrane protease [Methylovulum sp.]|uniref:CPBP family glutamic-type intramembrane protease n=1 Tax=Methylovulum sp. TaxID=1916980 RepID=UPI0026243B4F|nr:CPBP family glutamic-type intramembrane protease [Methylovulum sp.]MDD2725067.1 CPBP family glutamic-type intramembrane protease [Methylovulum sp.]MDD5125296.1 CPBP family glutamic-type intramembrane protease [Methylovulum sp.]
MRTLFYALVPLLVLLFAAVLASVIGFFIVQVFDGLPVQKAINKTTQVLLVLSIFPAMAWLKLTKTDLGFAGRKLFFKQLGQGFGLGFVTLMPVFIVLTILKINVLDESQAWTLAWFLEKSSIAVLLSLLISLIEEPLFRGILLAGLLKKLPVSAAVIISSAYYACLHFIKTSQNIPTADLTLSSTFGLLVDAFANLLNPDILSAFLALLMVGIFLGLLRTGREASLGLCIGCHTCWVWLIKMNKTLFNTDFNADMAFLVSPYDGVIGPLVTAWLLLAVFAYWFWQRGKQAL